MPDRSAPTKRQQLRLHICLCVAAVVLASPASWWVTGRASAQPVGGSSGGAVQLRSQSASLTVSIAKSAPTIAPTGTIQISVTASLRVPVRSLTVRVRIRRPNGMLVYQRTQTLTTLKAGTTAFQFKKSFSGLALREGRYPIEVLITAGALPAATLSDRLYLVKPGRPPVTLVIVPRFNYSPMIDPQGRFVIDPATATQARDEALALGGVIARSPQLKLSLGVPPLMLDEWRRIVSGYQTVGPEGVHDVPKNAPVTSTYAAALQSLRGAVSGGRLQLLDVPFADPDIEGLRSIRGLDDLKRHFDRGLSIYQASLGATPVAGTAVLGDALPNAAVPTLVSERIGFVLVKPEAVSPSKGATAAPGVYTIGGTKVRCLVIDQQASAILENPASSPEQLLDHLFTRLTSSTLASQPIVIDVRVGPGARTDATALESMLGEVSRSGWIRFATAEQAARTRPLTFVRLPTSSPAGTPAPAGYWTEVAQARTYAIAFIDAVTEEDADAEAAMYAALVSESRYWAGPDQSWSFADRGRAFAAAALRSSQDVLTKVAVTSQSITLAGSSGKVPISVRNDSGKTLNVDIVARGSHTRFPSGSSMRVALRPSDNYLTIPVDLGAGGFADRLTVSVTSGSVTLATTAIDVRASYLDRIVLVAMVVLVLLGLLLYIRHKATGEAADT